KVEVCVTSEAAARRAEAAGADRLELCSELAVGGVTPAPGLLQAIREAVEIPVHVLIRPRSGDFVYAPETFSQMLRDIAYCKKLGYEGFATGCLLEDGKLDVERMRLLAEAARGCHLTFHRAFDRLADWESAVTELEGLGVDTILTSGQAPSALQGLDLLEGLAKRTTCGIMPGGGIRPQNAASFVGKGFEAIHLSGIRKTPAEPAASLPLNSPQLLREGAPLQPDPNLIRELVCLLKDPGD
ncbi:MAG: copper homeostasis protein CutC, partial [Robiginitalea sp.]|nr:copper homeostasis protein CutC [Robiginitalea sp.]